MGVRKKEEKRKQKRILGEEDFILLAQTILGTTHRTTILRYHSHKQPLSKSAELKYEKE